MTDERLMTLLSTDDRRIPVSSVDEAVSAVLDMPVADARMLIRDGRGILFEGLSAEQARSLQSALEHAGVEVVVLPCGEVPEMVSPTSIRQLRPGEGVVRVQLGVNQGLTPLPHERISLISAGMIGTQTFWSETRDQVLQHLPDLRKLSGRNLRANLSEVLSECVSVFEEGERGAKENLLDDLDRLIRRETRWVIDLYCMSVPVRYRMERDRAWFSHVRAESEEDMRSDRMFLHVLTDLLLSVEEVAVSPRTGAFLQDPYRPGLVFDEDREFDRYNRWFLTMLEQGMQSSTSLSTSVNHHFGDGSESGATS